MRESSRCLLEGTGQRIELLFLVKPRILEYSEEKQSPKGCVELTTEMIDKSVNSEVKCVCLCVWVCLCVCINGKEHITCQGRPAIEWHLSFCLVQFYFHINSGVGYVCVLCFFKSPFVNSNDTAVPVTRCPGI